MKDLETIILPVLEMSCAVCANNVENTVKGLPGVEEASVNFAANTLSVKYHPSLITPQKMREAVQEAGYDLVVEVEDPTAVQEEMAREHYRKLRRNTIGAWVLSIPLALLGMVFMHTPGGNWIMMALALVIMIVFGRSFYVNGDTIHSYCILAGTGILQQCLETVETWQRQYGYIGGVEYLDRFPVQFLQYRIPAVLV